MLSFLVKLFSFANLNNQLFIQEHNSQNLSYTVGENQFIDHNYTNEFLISENHYLAPNTTEFIHYEDNLEPHRIDWRKNHKVSSVKNQEHCGGCWAFSSSGAIESAWAIKNNVLYNLSQQELIDCSTSYGNHGCGGGSMDLGFQYVIDNGLCTNLSYPYVASDQECQPDQCTSVVNITKYGDLEQNDETNLKRGVTRQPVSVAIQANKRSFQLYQSGIYSDLDCGTQLDHGVLVVGYGHDFDSGMNYWIIKNSWGPEWGENGYIKIQKDVEDERGLCGIAMQPSIPII
jgi:C1A family cysteine protease